MATINKIYPHVQVTTKALLRTYPEVVDNGATSLFVPFYSKKGLNNEIQKIYNMTQFISEYGNPDYEYQGRGILNIYNWLLAGGSVYALRLTAPDAVKATNAATTFGDAIAGQSLGEVIDATDLYTNNEALTTLNYQIKTVGDIDWISIFGTAVAVSTLTAGQQYKIVTLVGTDADWDTYLGTTGGTYAIGDIFTATTNDASALGTAGPVYVSGDTGTVVNVTTLTGTGDAYELLDVTHQGSISVTAKYPGSYYNDISLYITESVYSTDTVKYADVQILLDDSRVVSLSRVKYGDFATVLSSTGYVDVEITAGLSSTLEEDFIAFITAASASTAGATEIQLSAGSDGSFTFEQSLQRFFGSVSTDLNAETGDLTTATSIDFTVDTTEYAALNWDVNDTVTITNYAEEPTGTDDISLSFEVSGVDGVMSVTGTITAYVTGVLTVAVPATTSTNNWWKLDLDMEQDSYISAEKILSNKLELPIDVFLDPGYSQVSKGLIKNFAELIRDDVFFYFSEVDFSSNEIGSFEGAITFDGDGITYELNQAIYTQKFAVEDVISDTNLWVAPTYFLSSLLPYNDRVYGLQWPTAGLTRGVLTGVKGINLNPTSAEKTTNILAKVNYVEKDSRGYTFMSQLSGEADDTALQYINNIRVTNRMVRELENLGREYLFEFNDATTLVNMRNALNNYTDEWIQNRTLEYATVQVEKDAYSDERVNVNLTIKFVGIIDVISIDITIE